MIWENIQKQLQAATAPKYRVHRLLGYGGMAGVYLAEQPRLGRFVAIKVISPFLLADPQSLERFQSEARTVAKLSHPHIVTIYEVGENDGLHFFVMSFVPGASLGQVMDDAGATLPIDVVKVWLGQVGTALDYAHRRGVVHRDIKPNNIILDAEGNAQVTDFGIAKVADQPGLTKTGMLVGTPYYMSPEQCSGDPATGRSDQYSLGTVAYQMITGHPPFEGPTMSVLASHLRDTPAPILGRRKDCPPEVAEAIERMLLKDPEERWSSIGEALATLSIANPDLDIGLRTRMARWAGASGHLALESSEGRERRAEETTGEGEEAPGHSGGPEPAGEEVPPPASTPPPMPIPPRAATMAAPPPPADTEDPPADVPTGTAEGATANEQEPPAAPATPPPDIRDPEGAPPSVQEEPEPAPASSPGAFTMEWEPPATPPAPPPARWEPPSAPVAPPLPRRDPPRKRMPLAPLLGGGAVLVAAVAVGLVFVANRPSSGDAGQEPAETGQPAAVEVGSSPSREAQLATPPSPGVADLSRAAEEPPPEAVAAGGEAEAESGVTPAPPPGVAAPEGRVRLRGELPPGFRVTVRGQGAERTFTTPSFTLSPGAYDLRVEAPGHEPRGTRLEVPAAGEASWTPALQASAPTLPPPTAESAPSRGRIVVQGDLPDGSVVRVSGEGVNEVVRGGEILLSGGTYEVELTAPGYRTQSTRLTVSPGGEQSWRPELLREPPEDLDLRLTAELARLATALESRDMGQVRSAFPDVASTVEAVLGALVQDRQNVRGLAVSVGSLTRVEVSADHAVVDVPFLLSYRDPRNAPGQGEIRFRAHFAQSQGGWVLSEMERQR